MAVDRDLKSPRTDPISNPSASVVGAATGGSYMESCAKSDFSALAGVPVNARFTATGIAGKTALAVATVAVFEGSKLLVVRETPGIVRRRDGQRPRIGTTPRSRTP